VCVCVCVCVVVCEEKGKQKPVQNEDGSSSIAVIHRRHRSKSLLSCCVPNLRLRGVRVRSVIVHVPAISLSRSALPARDARRARGDRDTAELEVQARMRVRACAALWVRMGVPAHLHGELGVPNSELFNHLHATGHTRHAAPKVMGCQACRIVRGAFASRSHRRADLQTTHKAGADCRGTMRRKSALHKPARGGVHGRMAAAARQRERRRHRPRGVEKGREGEGEEGRGRHGRHAAVQPDSWAGRTAAPGTSCPPHCRLAPRLSPRPPPWRRGTKTARDREGTWWDVWGREGDADAICMKGGGVAVLEQRQSTDRALARGERGRL